MIPSLFTRQTLPIRLMVFLLIVASLLMWCDSKHPEWFSPLRKSSHAVMQPIYELSLWPSDAEHWISGTLQSKEALRRKNVVLQAQLLLAQAKLQQQEYVVAQNARLKGILSTPEPAQFDLNLAQVIGMDTNLLRQIVVLNQGAHDGVRVGQTVIDEKGVLGQIIDVYPKTSRLLLLTDEQLSVAVIIQRTGQRAIVTGNGTPTLLQLNYVFKTSDVRVGDELVSSGLGGRVPPGYRVGRVSRIKDTETDSFRTIEVSPAANFIDDTYVLIVQDKRVKGRTEYQ